MRIRIISRHQINTESGRITVSKVKVRSRERERADIVIASLRLIQEVTVRLGVTYDLLLDVYKCASQSRTFA